jgi:hypothetical protein
MSDRSQFVHTNWGKRLAAPLALAAVLLVGLVYASHGRAATTSCPGTFQVLHDDKIGTFSLPGGAYKIKATNISCSSTSSLFTTFLNDWDGKLPGGWRTVIKGVGNGGFTGPRGQSFTVEKTGSSGGGGTGLVCSRRFVLKQDDRIGALVMKKGQYIIDRLGPLSPSCSADASLLSQFLMDFDGVLPGGWTVLPDDGTFVRGSVSYGFRVEPAPNNNGGGGSNYPTTTTRCPAAFRVLHNDQIGILKFPAGNYWVSIYKGTGITCPQSSQLFASFLARTDGKLPPPWVISVSTGSFRKGNGSSFGFVAKPAFNVGHSTHA